MPRNIRPIRIDGQVAYVPLTRGYEAIIDADDVEFVKGYNWQVFISKKTAYAQRADCSSAKLKSIRMHREIMGNPEGLQVDHVDGNGLNNTKANLRIATHGENCRNKRSLEGSSSKYLGVCWHKQRGKWVAGIWVDGKRKHLGIFVSEVDAATAYDNAAKIYHNGFANTNFT